ncbi:MAG: cysteine synthase A [Oscillospiraceae bacterium]|nr:cysteine synthase A [Oscillospiraceae bacterium]MBQ8172062.1 cysteine synthase A [Oscillospiraceae bacterium]
MMLYKDITELIGSTPLLEISRFAESNGANGKLFAKLERTNPAGSAKDRVALYMIRDAEKRGALKKGGVIVEPTSGNTGIGLAAVGARLGYRVILTMPDTMSVERRKLIAAYGAEVVLTPGAEGMKGAIAKAQQIAEELSGFIPGQFENNANVLAHYETTGPEIWNDMAGDIDVFIASVGTGGTLTGVARCLKEKKPDIRIVAVEPKDSPLLSEGKAGPHKIQGIGANFVPDILDKSLIDEIITVSAEDAFRCGRELAKTEGILVGISSGAVLAAALSLGEELKGRKTVMVLTDTGERYLSSEMFAEG